MSARRSITDRVAATPTPDLPPLTRLVWHAFASFADRRIVPTEANLVELTGVSPSTLHRSVARLRATGYLVPAGDFIDGRADRRIPTYRVIVKR